MVKHLAANQKVGDWNPPATRREKDVSICCCKDYSPAYLGPDSGTAVAFRSAPLCPPALSALLLVPTHAVKVPAMQPATTEAQETLEIANQGISDAQQKEISSIRETALDMPWSASCPTHTPKTCCGVMDPFCVAFLAMVL
ncbi:uncharacterized protein LOC126076925 isoform X2 [Elephas maximus indicus]|uniref:uncharacterized protein LOC126076925 isoform X2 n=1 Tax=Elephas maximus indicus TaxID=99487 RepID=UPI0021163713|nr:uncharacterized protein LOC126076925 isoform X2 [Elephas maximus indicus]